MISKLFLRDPRVCFHFDSKRDKQEEVCALLARPGTYVGSANMDFSQLSATSVQVIIALLIAFARVDLHDGLVGKPAFRVRELFWTCGCCTFCLLVITLFIVHLCAMRIEASLWPHAHRVLNLMSLFHCVFTCYLLRVHLF